MDKHSYTGAVGRIGPYALLLGALVLPGTAISASNDMDRQSPMGYGAGGYGMPPAWGSYNDPTGAKSAGSALAPETMGEAVDRAMGGFMNYMQQGRMQQPGGYAPSYGPGMGHGPYGAYHYDNATVPGQQPSPEYMTGGGHGGMSNPPSGYVPPMFGQGAPSDQGPMAQGNSAQGMFPKGMFPGAADSCVRKSSMGRGGMGHSGMSSGSDIMQLLRISELSEEQREKILGILDELRRSHWGLMGENMDHSVELRKLYGAQRLDAKAIGAVYGKIFDAKRKMIESGIEAKQKAKDVLTDEQREQLQSREKAGC
uniref:Signaling pathway modulator ZraP n=1 Tax=Candidatus Kentrum sp. FM TaxID=2126340 RepID=A0A450TSC5_9GAMM|nr:MAG: Heavy-metal resistance [Candidatus Kentron sp. FM]VFJ71764.1 MAG: Heavy-metal resistance [Candidatus Kentron sp. FM]VFK21331.1 MAG: Heavy-metal resistance [Candidatus Kentron sp. FM]